MSFPRNFGKFEIQQKTLEKLFWTNFVKSKFLGICRQILGELSESFLFYNIINFLSTRLLVPYSDILIRTDFVSSLPTSTF